MTGPADNVRLTISLRVNGELIERETPVRKNLADFLRDDLGLTGTHVGCEHGVCGACTIRVDGRSVRSCLMLAVQADGCEVVTVEGLTASGEIADLQTAFVQRNALQCGYCTPGMLATAADFLASERPRSRDAIREFMSGNYCRCTGYQAIVDAIEDVARARAGQDTP
ncbi:MAG: (2Fe-2S)-binding protein [Pseudorhodoplanes sp.]|nr:(2Fe-2S)-binding protein [Pseudorhodoplanes sp.]GIK80319.1 MAG: (2Fe-2S)-binding protein [Alphaproteobacteria bacterium]